MTEISKQARDAAINRLAEAGAEDFKRIFKALFEQLGWNVNWRAETGPEGDLYFFADHIPYSMSRPGLVGRVRRRPGAGTASEIEAVTSTIADWDDDMVAYIALDGFTDDARELKQSSGRRILLTDADELIDMWAEHYDSIDPGERELLPLTRSNE